MSTYLTGLLAERNSFDDKMGDVYAKLADTKFDESAKDGFRRELRELQRQRDNLEVLVARARETCAETEAKEEAEALGLTREELLVIAKSSSALTDYSLHMMRGGTPATASWVCLLTTMKQIQQRAAVAKRAMEAVARAEAAVAEMRQQRAAQRQAAGQVAGQAE
jgi:hypothetical protein